MGCCLIKYLMFICNTLFALLGLGVISVGTVAYLNVIDVIHTIPRQFDAIKLAPIFTIVVGCIVFLVAFLGCCGAITDNTCMLTTFATILIVIILMQIAIGGFTLWIFRNSEKWERRVEIKFQDQIKHYNDTKNPSNAKVDEIQTKLECCGATGVSDYEKGKVPKSCCQKGNDNASCDLYEDGCVEKILDELQRGMHVAGYVFIAVATLEIASVIAAIWLTCSIYKQNRLVLYEEDQF